AALRRMRWPVERGSMPYSAVTQPLPELRSHEGTFSSRLAVQRTCVSPNLTRHEPSACLEMPLSKLMARISSGCRLDGRIDWPFGVCKLQSVWAACSLSSPMEAKDIRATYIRYEFSAN